MIGVQRNRLMLLFLLLMRPRKSVILLLVLLLDNVLLIAVLAVHEVIALPIFLKRRRSSPLNCFNGVTRPKGS